MTAALAKPRRPRRVAADEAHSWARNLRLGNPFAKLVLSMLTLYVNGEGICFVGIEQLAEDTELSMDTVRKRLAWLEAIGAIARFAQWLDGNGRRNSEGKGRRTSDEIRLLIDVDPDEIEARAAGNSGDGSVPVCPSPQQGQNSDEDSVSPPVALGQPSDSSKGQDSSNQEPEEIPPNPPLGGVRVVDEVLENDLSEAIKVYPAPITDLPKFRTVMAALSEIERRKVITAMRAYSSYIADLEKRGKSRTVKDAHRWVAQGQWQGFVAAGEKIEIAALRQEAPIDSDPGKAWSTLHRIAHITPLASGGNYVLPRALTPQELAVANAPPDSEWPLIPGEQTNQCGAWNELLGTALKGKSRPQLVWNRNPGGVMGFKAPWPWPPRKDGTIPPTEQERT